MHAQKWNTGEKQRQGGRTVIVNNGAAVGAGAEAAVGAVEFDQLLSQNWSKLCQKVGCQRIVSRVATENNKATYTISEVCKLYCLSNEEPFVSTRES